MKSRASLLCVGAALLAWRCLAAEPESLPAPWKHRDVGAVSIKGNATAADGVFTLKGTLDTWGTNDGFHFVWQRFQGDGEIVARVLAVENTLNHAKGGVMFRDTLAPDSKHVEACVTAVDGTQFLARTETGGKTTSAHPSADKGKFPYWVRLVRAGEKFTGYDSADGEKWTEIGSTNVTMSASIFVGLAGSSHQKTTLGTATFDKVTVTSKK